MISAGFTLLLLALGCVGGTADQSGEMSPTPGSPAVTDLDSLVAYLRAAGLSVEVKGETTEPLFSGKATFLSVDGGGVEVLEYDDAESADAEAGRISPDGTKIETDTKEGKVATDISWIATPHFYKSGKLIVLYVGADAAVTVALEAALGSQFAGG